MPILYLFVWLFVCLFLVVLFCFLFCFVLFCFCFSCFVVLFCKVRIGFLPLAYHVIFSSKIRIRLLPFPSPCDFFFKNKNRVLTFCLTMFVCMFVWLIVCFLKSKNWVLTFCLPCDCFSKVRIGLVLFALPCDFFKDLSSYPFPYPLDPYPLDFFFFKVRSEFLLFPLPMAETNMWFLQFFTCMIASINEDCRFWFWQTIMDSIISTLCNFVHRSLLKCNIRL